VLVDFTVELETNELVSLTVLLDLRDVLELEAGEADLEVGAAVEDAGADIVPLGVALFEVDGEVEVEAGVVLLDVEDGS